MSDRLAFSSYSTDGRDEHCLKAGKDHPAQILIVPPLFDEMNRMRRALVDVMRLLDANAIGSTLPDLPGTNESTLPQEQATLSMWKKALADCAKQHGCSSNVASFRGGCLIDEVSHNTSHWRLTPAKGKSLLRTMMRTRIASDKESGISTKMDDLITAALSGPILLAGNTIGSQMFADLQSAEPAAVPALRSVRLESDSQPSDVKISGSPLWLRAEPDADAQLSLSIAADLTAWVRQ